MVLFVGLQFRIYHLRFLVIEKISSNWFDEFSNFISLRNRASCDTVIFLIYAWNILNIICNIILYGKVSGKRKSCFVICQLEL